MPVTTDGFSAAGAAMWTLLVVATAFVVAWLFAGRLRMARTAYVGVLFVVTAAVSTAYVTTLGGDVGDLLALRSLSGLAGGLVVGAITAVAMLKMPSTLHRSYGRTLAAAGWEGVVYGVAEGVLLSALPALIGWQGAHALGWEGTSAGVARWSWAVLASVLVIVAHHLGYWEYRNRMLVPITVACTLLTVAYLVTGSVLAPVVGHVLMHLAAIRHGTELPPHVRNVEEAFHEHDLVGAVRTRGA